MPSPLYLLLGVASAAIALAACSSPTTVCAGVQIVRSTLPDTTTIKVGAATIAIGGESYGWCGAPGEHPPARFYVWHAADSSIASVTPIDSIHAKIIGLRPGHTLVIPAYVGGRDALDAVTVTVVP